MCLSVRELSFGGLQGTTTGKRTCWAKSFTSPQRGGGSTGRSCRFHGDKQSPAPTHVFGPCPPKQHIIQSMVPKATMKCPYFNIPSSIHSFWKPNPNSVPGSRRLAGQQHSERFIDQRLPFEGTEVDGAHRRLGETAGPSVRLKCLYAGCKVWGGGDNLNDYTLSMGCLHPVSVAELKGKMPWG